MAAPEVLRVGVDVGGTNTDAVILCGRSLISWCKVTTTSDITSGISRAISNCLHDAGSSHLDKKIVHVSVGTTHFVNAVVQRQNLAKVAVIRLCGSASHALPPLSDFPDDLAEVVNGGHYMISGGYEFDGEEIAKIDTEEVLDCAKQLKEKGLKQIVVSGIFSPVNSKQEVDVANILLDEDPDFSITLAHEIGHLGILERENAAVLNECLKPLCQTTIQGFSQAFKELGLNCPFYLTQNDGTLISSEECIKFPVRTFASGPTNSMRGASFLSGEENGIVIDIGGTTSDVGVLMNGFPREAATRVKIGGVPTNFRMPDVLSIGLGGGSIVRERDRRRMRETICVVTDVDVGPVSVGNHLEARAIIFGGAEVTATDIVSAAGLVKNIGDWKRAKNVIPKMIVDGAMTEIVDMLEKAIDSVKVSAEDQPVIVVGGGSVLVEDGKLLAGASRVMKPKCYQVANAVGAALSQIGHTVDKICCYELAPRELSLSQSEAEAKAAVIEGGAVPESVKIVEVHETPLAYVSRTAVRVRIKAVGDLIIEEKKCDAGRREIGFRHSISRSASKPCNDREDSETSPAREIGDMDNFETFIPKTLDAENGEWLLGERDVDCICIGAGILGCGGGGSPYLARLRAMKLLRAGKKIRIIRPERLDTSPELRGLIAMIAFMGAPTVIVEKLISGTEVSGAVQLAEKIVGADLKECGVDEIEHVGYKEICPKNLDKLKPKELAPKICALMCGEIGGLNAAEPLAVAAELDLPVVDCDGMGRAFPELQMCYPFMSGYVNAYPSTLVDEKGTRFAVTYTRSAKDLELFFRRSVLRMGCKGGVCLSVLTAEQVQTRSIPYSYSRAWLMGNAVLRAREQKISPISVLLKSVHGKRLIHGKVTDVKRMTEKGFVNGQLIVQGYGRFQDCTLYVMFQNENLIAKYKSAETEDIETVATTPDLISILDSVTGDPVSTEEVRYGMRVVVIAMACHPHYRTEQSLEFVGPKYFGYDVEYTPVCEYVYFSS